MLLEPTDITGDTVLGIVQEYWDPGVVTGAFLPVGAGSHHWVCSGRHRPRWFVTADDVGADGRLEELLDTYAAARALAGRGHHVVVPTVAPDPDAVGVPKAVGVVHGRYLVTVAAYLEGESGPGEYADDNQRALIAGALGSLHAARPPRRVRPWRPGPPSRAELTALLARLDVLWTAGPCGEPARKALRRNGSRVERLYRRFDELAPLALAGRKSWVLTHGEPHTANVLWQLGGPVLVDWESLRLAPRERDLRTVLRGADSAEPLSAYAAHGGTVDLDADMVELFDLEWWLGELADSAARFSRPHSGDADDQRCLHAFLDRARSEAGVVVPAPAARR